MKWVFAFNQASEQSYGDFVRVAVASALKNTNLEPICLYDGESGELSRWLEAQGVAVFPCEFRFKALWGEFLNATDGLGYLKVVSGAFLRVEIIDLLERENKNDAFVLYTDCDILFQSDPSPVLGAIRPKFFAVAPETFQTNRLHMNSGAMWMNVRSLRQENEPFLSFVREHINPKFIHCLDQELYRAYFNPPHKLAWRVGIPDQWFYAVMSRLRIRTWKWDDLPLELNWKPYWGENDDAIIIHFHGLKPTQRAALAAGALPPNIASMHTPAWEKYAAQWEEWLQKARRL